MRDARATLPVRRLQQSSEVCLWRKCNVRTPVLSITTLTSQHFPGGSQIFVLHRAPHMGIGVRGIYNGKIRGKSILGKKHVFFKCFTIWQLEASRCVQNDVRGCANIFHCRKPHSENFIFRPLFTPPPFFRISNSPPAYVCYSNSPHAFLKKTVFLQF